jgi:cobalt-precorrin 5A hydrolase
VIVAGIGSRKGVSAAEVAAALDAALARAGLTRADVGALATPAVKGGEPGITAAATALGLPLVLVPQKTLEAAAGRTLTTSDRVIALMGVPSASETAALAACGPDGKLIAPRTAVGPVTCALARREPPS